MVTVSNGTLYFHSVPFRSDLPVKQTVILQNMTVNDLMTTINGMGYAATLDAGVTDLAAMKAYILMEVQDVPLTADLQAFTSMTWKTLYPLYRVLRDAEGNVELALQQLYTTSASGDWLDYWATFFSIQREGTEADNDFIRRFMMWIFNPKTNNIALKELLAYRLKDNSIDVTDDSPGKFKVIVDQKYLDNAGDLNKILLEAKAAGIEYFLAYSFAPYYEDYRVYLSNVTGTPIENLDFISWQLTKPYSENNFPAPTDSQLVALAAQEENIYIIQQNNIDSCFTINFSTLSQDPLFGGQGSDIAFATLTVNGNIVRQIVL